MTKKPGENAVDVARAARQRVDELRNTVIPAGIEATITRDYGATAAEKANKLIQKLAFATGSVILLVGLALGRREAVIVGAAVILTLTATLFASWAWGFTLNRVILFALIFSIGILVDDAIVVVENIHRHQQLDAGRAAARHHSARGGRGRRPDHPGHADGDRGAAADGLRERPDGPVHEPDPDQPQPGHGAVAGHRLHRHALAGAEADEAARHGWATIRTARTRRAASAPPCRALFAGLLAAVPGQRAQALAAAGRHPGGADAVGRHWPAVQWVVLKMLPFDNKSEFQLVVDMPAGTPLEDTAAALHEMARFLARQPEVLDLQGYAGTASPITFNGLVRQYYLRADAEQGDLQVNLVDKKHRHEQSHAIAQRLRPAAGEDRAAPRRARSRWSKCRPARR